MTQNIHRRDFIKKTGVAAGGLALTATGLPLFFQEQPGTFEPNDSHWARDLHRPNKALERDMDVDIVIIGGGYTGLSAGWHLATTNPDIDIVLLEAQTVGFGASGRNGGMVLPQTGPESFEIAEDIATHKLTYDLTVDSMKSMKKLVDSSGIDSELVLDGYCVTLGDEDDIPAWQYYIDSARQAGMPLELWDRQKTEQKLGTRLYAGAVYDPNGGQVHPLKLVQSLKKATEDAGVAIFEFSAVSRITEGEKIVLDVGPHRITARAIVLATNAYTSKLGYFNHRIIPFHVQCGATPPLSEKQLAELNWRSRLPFFDDKDALYHVVLTRDRRLVVGGRSAEYFIGNDLRYGGNLAEIDAIMRREMYRIFPSLQGVPFERVWNGPICMTFDGVEAVGVTGEYKNIFYGLGYNGHGINTAFMFGSVIAAMYNREDHDWENTAYYNHVPPLTPPDPYKWLGVQTALKYYKWKSRG